MFSKELFLVFLSISFVKCQVAYDYSYEDDEYYGDEDNNVSTNSEVKDQLKILPTPSKPGNEDNNLSTKSEVKDQLKILPTPPKPDPEFRANVTCSPLIMTLEIDKTFLPTGLGFAGSISEDVVKASNPNTIPCIQVTHNETHYIYSVALRCHRAVGKLDYGTKIIYTHELDLEDFREQGSIKKNTYSVIIDCETTSETENDEKIQTWIPKYRLFEHRVNESCSIDTCSLKELCLPSDDISGYFCSCPYGCSCPQDFYACSLGVIQTKIPSNLICIRSEQLCDSKYDCPLQDDEECDDLWTQWSAWSVCSVSCGTGTQIRKRSCANNLNNNPLLFNKKCSEEEESATDFRRCEQTPCTSVSCGANEMIIEIPLENGMNKQSVDRRMHLAEIQDDEDCRPKLNTSYAIFVIPLHKCNTQNLVDGDIISYTNVVMYEVEDQDSMILREYAHSYTAKCTYKRRQTVSMRRIDGKPGAEFEELAVLKYEQKSSSLRDANKLDAITHYSSGDGAFEYAMYIYDDSSYSKPYEEADYPLEKKLGERLYIAVDFMSQDEDLHVFIERCWATSSNDSAEYREDELRYLFINGGCPIDSTVRFHNTLDTQFSDRYSIESFKFNDEQHWYIYFRCDVILCDASENDPACSRECNSAYGVLRNLDGIFATEILQIHHVHTAKDVYIVTSQKTKRRKRRAPNSERSYARVMQGPIIVYEKEDGENLLWNSGISVGSVEHKILTVDDVQRKESSRSMESDRGDASIFESSSFVAAIVGCVCLFVGVAVGLIARNKNKRAMFTEKTSRDDSEKNTAQTAAERDVLIEVQNQS